MFWRELNGLWMSDWLLWFKYFVWRMHFEMNWNSIEHLHNGWFYKFITRTMQSPSELWTNKLIPNLLRSFLTPINIKLRSWSTLSEQHQFLETIKSKQVQGQMNRCDWDQSNVLSWVIAKCSFKAKRNSRSPGICYIEPSFRSQIHT